MHLFVLLFKRQNDRKICQISSWFSTFFMSLPYLCPILAHPIRLSKDNSKVINFSFFSHLVGVYEGALEVKMPSISCKFKANYAFLSVAITILDVSIL